MLKKLISKNQNRRLIFFNKNKRTNIQNEEIDIKTSIQVKKEDNILTKTETKEF